MLLRCEVKEWEFQSLENRVDRLAERVHNLEGQPYQVYVTCENCKYQVYLSVKKGEKKPEKFLCSHCGCESKT